jgi:hypothetical protein
MTRRWRLPARGNRLGCRYPTTSAIAPVDTDVLIPYGIGTRSALNTTGTNPT